MTGRATAGNREVSGGQPPHDVRAYRHHFEAGALVAAPPETLFGRMDDHHWLASHMTGRSAMMAGSAMSVEIDGLGGRAVGSRIAMSGRVLGLRLRLVEAVVQRDPPLSKAWETVGEPRLLVIGRYRMGFAIVPVADGSHLTMFIDYDDPAPPWRWLGRIPGGIYARWCVRAMVEGTAAAFRAPRRSGGDRGSSVA